MEPEKLSEATGQNSLASVPIEVVVSVGRARPLVRDLLELNEGTILKLDRHIDDPVELYVGDRLIGVGTLEVQEGDGQEKLTVRVLEVLPLQVSN